MAVGNGGVGSSCTCVGMEEGVTLCRSAAEAVGAAAMANARAARVVSKYDNMVGCVSVRGK